MTFRQILTAFLMLLMLTPSMVCFMAFCPDMAQAAEKPMPCHEMPQKKADLAAGPMLAKDCLKNDLGQTATIDTPEPQGSIIIFSFVFPLMFAGLQISPRSRYGGIGPPPKRRPSFHLLLITQRFLQ